MHTAAIGQDRREAFEPLTVLEVLNHNQHLLVEELVEKSAHSVWT